MKLPMLVLLLCAVALAGCNGVWMNAEYTQLVDETAAMSSQTACLAARGMLDANQMVESLTVQATIWQKLREARGGVSP